MNIFKKLNFCVARKRETSEIKTISGFELMTIITDGFHFLSRSLWIDCILFGVDRILFGQFSYIVEHKINYYIFEVYWCQFSSPPSLNDSSFKSMILKLSSSLWSLFFFPFKATHWLTTTLYACIHLLASIDLSSFEAKQNNNN